MFFGIICNGTYFSQVSLKQLGLIIRLGHIRAEETCSVKTSVDSFTVLDLYGIHDVAIEFCHCSDILPHIQLLRFGWYPATVERPQSAATLVALKFFQLLNFESKTTAFEFHSLLSRLTDNTGTQPTKVCGVVNIGVH